MPAPMSGSQNQAIDKLIDRLSKIPGLGRRSARRAALKMLQSPGTMITPLVAALTEAEKSVLSCDDCGNLDCRNPCGICSDPRRDRSIICVVEGVGDLWAFERGAVHQGLYHVLGGTLSALAGVRAEDLSVPGLLSRVNDGGVKEIVLALPATVDGATTAYWLTDQVRPLGVAVTLMAQGVPIGGSLDTLDDGTLGTALRGRRPAPGAP